MSPLAEFVGHVVQKLTGVKIFVSPYAHPPRDEGGYNRYEVCASNLRRVMMLTESRTVCKE